MRMDSSERFFKHKVTYMIWGKPYYSTEGLEEMNFSVLIYAN